MSLKQKIIEKIKSEGPISFEAFMDMCLYYPDYGYYMKNSTKIGKAGDFYTSPHLHPLFGVMLAKQVQEMWEIMDKPDDFNIVEMGAGMGYLAKDMLEYLKVSGVRCQVSRKEKEVFKHLKYTIIELNPAIKSKQQELLADFKDKVNWISHLDELTSVKGCFLSNELLDAFPIRLVEMEDELKEIFVSLNGNDLIEIKMPSSIEVKNYFKEFCIELPYGYRTEVNLRAKDWLRAVSNKLSEGFILTIDYGYSAKDYYSEDRDRGTLLCYFRHRINENPYENIGEQDITAHVNFSSLKKWAEELHVKSIGFCSQGTYLVSLGIDEAINEIYGHSPVPLETAKIKGLVFPHGMGESHRVMIHYKGRNEIQMRGFSIRNQANRL